MRRRPLEPEPGNAGGGNHGTRPGPRSCSRVATHRRAPRSATSRRTRAVIAADSGLDHAHAPRRRGRLVVGDLDSVDPETLAAAELAGTTVERHPAAKDATDLELALLAARDRGAREIVVVGGHGGRLDHFLANALLLATPALADVARPRPRRRRRGVRRPRPARAARHAGRAVLAAPGRRTRRRRPHRRSPVPPRRRDALPGVDPRREQRVRHGVARPCRSSTVCCSPSSPPSLPEPTRKDS